jgi:hypothetical protein
MKKFIIMLLIFSCTGCITKTLWQPEGYHVVEDKKYPTWKYEKKETYVKYKINPDGWGFIPDEPKMVKKENMPTWQKICLTPLTLCLGIVTAPIQDFAVDPFDLKKEKLKREKEKRWSTPNQL